jgi:hypothetical protein
MPTPEELLLKFRKRQAAESQPQEIASTSMLPMASDPAAQDETGDISAMAKRLKARQAVNVQNTGIEGPGFLARVGDVFTGALRETPESRQTGEMAASLVKPEYFTPEVMLQEEYKDESISSGNYLKDLKLTAGLLFASSDKAKADIMLENLPGSKKHDDAAGNTFVTLPDGRKFMVNGPGFTFQDAMTGAGEIAAFYGPGKLAQFGTKGAGIAGRLAANIAAEAGTEAALQKGVQVLGSEQPISPIDVAAAGLTAGVGEVGGAPLGALRRRGAQKTLGADVAPGGAGALPPTTPPPIAAGAIEPEKTFVSDLLKDVARGEEIAEKTGIPLFRAQKTLDPTDIDRQSYVSLLSGGSRVAAGQLKKQNQKSYDAVVDFLATVAPERQIGGAAVRARSAADMVIDAQKELRKEASSPFYKEAFKNKTRYKPKQTAELIDKKIKLSGINSPLEKSMSRIKGFIGTRGKKPLVASDLTIRQMHESKRSVDDMIGKAVRQGENALAKDLIDVKKTLISEMAEFSPNYNTARKRFAAQSPAVEALENSLVGRVSKLKDDQLKRVTSTIFDPTDIGTSIPNVKSAKKAIESVDPGAWGDIVRLELEKRLGSARGSLEQVGETTLNTPGVIKRALFGSKKKRDILYAALDADQKKNLRYLEEGLDRASKGRPGGSPTATRLRFEKEIAGTGGKIAKFFRPLKGASEAAQEFSFNKNAFALSQIMFNPKWKPDMRKLRKFKPDSPESAAMFSDMMNKAAKDFRKPAAQAVRPESE